MREIIWEPYGDYKERANIKRFMDKHGIRDYDELISRSVNDIEWFWEEALKDLGVEWYRHYDKILDTALGFPWAKWFIGGKLNIVHNCLDRHIKSGKGAKIAIIWEGDDGATRKVSYSELYRDVNRVASALKGLGIGKGDRIGIYMPMVPEIVVALYSCLKIGAVAVPVFSGFGPKALATRLDDAEAKVLFTSDVAKRKGTTIEIKKSADEAGEMVKTLRHKIVFRRGGGNAPWDPDSDIWWDDLTARGGDECKTEELDAEDHSLIIYTSGTTGKPKGTVHTHAGCLAQMSKEIGYYFDLKATDIFFWFTDIGWMMGPWEIIGVQHFGGTYVIFEGVPNYPAPDRLWQLIERHKVSILGISPTAIRLLMSLGDRWIDGHDLGSLRILGSTGEPWDIKSYMWYFEKVGGKRCPIINISGGTEIVGCLLSPLPITALKPCTLRGPGLGMDIDVFNDEGKPVRGGIGHLVCKKPAPSMTRGFLKDPERYIDTYFSRWPGVWYHGDWAKVDEDGFWFLYGRSDDTIKIAGKRVGPAEIESSLMEHPAVSEAAAIGIPHEIKGEAIICFVVVKSGIESTDQLKEELKAKVGASLGKSLKPEDIKFVRALPKTRSAKIVRGAIRKKYLGQEVGDLSSVENPDAIEEIGMAI
ncbi:MAG: acetate--CoA ligase [Nitrospirae bacterium]|nr:acetate--CoA ligase [Nitrospirota bacterium]